MDQQKENKIQAEKLNKLSKKHRVTVDLLRDYREVNPEQAEAAIKTIGEAIEHRFRSCEK